MDPGPLPFLEAKPPEHYIRLALAEARKALETGDVPVGAVIVDAPTGNVVARAHNQREMLRDPTAHAEVLAITQAAAHYDSWRLPNAMLFVTLEPCVMCAGAIVLARLPRVFYAAEDAKAGAHASVFNVLVHPQQNHRPDVVGGLCASESAELLREFFRGRRNKPTNGDHQDLK